MRYNHARYRARYGRYASELGSPDLGAQTLIKKIYIKHAWVDLMPTCLFF